MALNLLQVIKIIAQSKSAATTVSKLIKDFREQKNNAKEIDLLKDTLSLQAEINEKMESQIKLLQSAIESLQKSLKVIIIIAIAALMISVISLLLIIIL